MCDDNVDDRQRRESCLFSSPKSDDVSIFVRLQLQKNICDLYCCSALGEMGL